VEIHVFRSKILTELHAGINPLL